VPNTLDSFFSKARRYINEGNCERIMDGQTIDPFKKTVDPEKLKNCLMIWAFKTKEGKSH